MKEVQLTQGYVAFVDDEDFERVSKYPWTPNVCSTKNTVYAQRNMYREDGKRTTQSLQRFILGVTDHKAEVDHEDHNGLNCQKYNMRLATKSQNQANSVMPTTNTSGVKGVYKYVSKAWKTCNKWKAQISFKGNRKHLGYFDTKEEAQAAYDKAAVELFGEFALTNEKV
jgi:hypothetical protein